MNSIILKNIIRRSFSSLPPVNLALSQLENTIVEARASGKMVTIGALENIILGSSGKNLSSQSRHFMYEIENACQTIGPNPIFKPERLRTIIEEIQKNK